MPDRTDIIYEYDGSLEGLLSCVFESFARHETPSAIRTPDDMQTVLFPIRAVPTDQEKARRVLSSIPLKMGADALELTRQAFLTCHPEKELLILRFLILGYRRGPSVMRMLADETVSEITKAVLHLTRESHLLKGFLRFSDFHGVLVAEMEPKNIVLPLLAEHFCRRYPGEQFLIYDKTHGMALKYRPFKAVILPVEDLALSEPDETEKNIRELWKLYYNTIEIRQRHNPRCRMTHMPKRYWKYLTEMANGTALQA